MRVALTVADPPTGRTRDVIVDADPATPLAEITAALAGRTGGPESGSTVVSLADVRAPARPRTLYLDGRALDPQQPLADSPLVDGCVLTMSDAGEPQSAVLGEPSGVVELRIVAGPGAGTVHVLGVGEATIGADQSCAAALSAAGLPPLVAVAAIGVGGTVHLRPVAGSDLALSLDREPLSADGAQWPFGGELQLGDVLLELHQPQPPDAALLPSQDGAWLDYNRPPRLLPPLRQTTFRLPKPPVAPSGRGLPALGSLAPALLGVVMAFVLRNPMYLLMAAMTPMMLLGNALSSKRQGKKTYRQQLADYRAESAAIEADAAAALVAERRARRDANPDPAQLLLVAVGPRARLWERRRADPDHLSVRVGTADLPSEVVVEDPEQLEHRRMVQRLAPDVPVAIGLREAGVVGVAAAGELPRRLASWMVGQLAVLQSPRDVQVYVLTDGQAEDDWRWAGWLPHLHPALGQDAYALLGVDAETLGRRVAELGQVIAARRTALANAGGAAALDEPDLVVVLDGARRLRALPGVVTLLRDGPAVGVYSICLDADERLLPE